MEGAIDAIAPFFWSPAGLVGTMIGPIGAGVFGHSQKVVLVYP
ncbi:MAG: hypothetical protein VKL01_13145 [Limnothrix sp.]|nr:hypothetical protein [Limnothrix sp.]